MCQRMLLCHPFKKTCPGRKMHCSVCDVDFIGPTMFEEHLLKCKPTINCNFCGCTETLGTITEHLSKCTLRQVQCEHCNGLMCVKLVKDHMENSCPDRMIRCLQCSHFFAVNVIGQHHMVCPRRIIRCSACNIHLEFNTLASHLILTCANRMTPCGWCSESMPCYKLADHIQGCREKFVLLVGSILFIYYNHYLLL